MRDKLHWRDLEDWHTYSPEELQELREQAIALANLERARAMRAGLRWLIARVRQPFARLGAHPEGTDVAPSATPHRA